MKRGLMLLAAAALPLGACTMAGDHPASAGATPVAGGEGPCHNEGLDRFTGRKATAEIGAELLKASGATSLRWGPPHSAMTMDYRADRLTVSYDEAMLITSARCG